MRVTVGAAKGGVGKTTTAMMLGFVMAGQGRTLVVDVDQVQQSSLTWRRVAETDGYPWPALFEVVPWSRSVDRTFDSYEHVVFDVGPRRADLFREAITRSDTVVVPAGPRPADIAEIAPAVESIAAVADAGHPTVWGVLITMLRLGTASAAEAPRILEANGTPVLDVRIPLREMYSLAYGTVPERFGAYVDLLAELTEEPPVG